MAQEERLKALEAAIGKIEKDFGKGAIMKLGESGANMNVETVPTGSLSLDVALDLAVYLREELLRSTDQSPVVRPP